MGDSRASSAKTTPTQKRKVLFEAGDAMSNVESQAEPFSPTLRVVSPHQHVSATPSSSAISTSHNPFTPTHFTIDAALKATQRMLTSCVTSGVASSSLLTALDEIATAAYDEGAKSSPKQTSMVSVVSWWCYSVFDVGLQESSRGMIDGTQVDAFGTELDPMEEVRAALPLSLGPLS